MLCLRIRSLDEIGKPMNSEKNEIGLIAEYYLLNYNYL